MKQWMNRLITLIGVLLIILAIYLFSKPYIDNYLHEKDNDYKVKIMIKRKKNRQRHLNRRQRYLPINLKWLVI